MEGWERQTEKGLMSEGALDTHAPLFGQSERKRGERRRGGRQTDRDRQTDREVVGETGVHWIHMHPSLDNQREREGRRGERGRQTDRQ